MKITIRLTALIAFLLMGSMAQATPYSFDIAGINDCGGQAYYGNDPCSISVDGEQISPLLGKWTSGNDNEPAELSTSSYGTEHEFDWDLMTFSDAGGNALTGTGAGSDWETLFDQSTGSWSYSGDAIIRFWIAKGSRNFRVYFDSDAEACSTVVESFACMNFAKTVSSGSWDMAGLRDGTTPSLSHITFFNEGGSPPPPPPPPSVPEPGTLALLGLGLIGIGASRRRKVA